MNIIHPLILISDSSHPTIRLHGSFRLPFLVIVEHPSEAIERGTIPPLFAGKRNALLARRLTQIFPESDYRGAFPDRRHRSFITPPSRFLFWAITDSVFLDQYLTELFSSSQPIRGIWTITQVVRMLLVDARITNRATHLIVLSSPAGTRLIAWQQQEIVLTRLITYPLSSQELKAELDRTVQYLYNQGWRNAMSRSLFGSGALFRHRQIRRFGFLSLHRQLLPKNSNGLRTILFRHCLAGGSSGLHFPLHLLPPVGYAIGVFSSGAGY